MLVGMATVVSTAPAVELATESLGVLHHILGLAPLTAPSTITVPSVLLQTAIMSSQALQETSGGPQAHTCHKALAHMATPLAALQALGGHQALPDAATPLAAIPAPGTLRFARL
jgi:hypothetical protein